MTNKKSFFITGTDTGAGKTFVACLIAESLKNKGIDVGVMKPVETGCAPKEGEMYPEDAMRLKEASGSEDALDLINPYRFSLPLAPSIASELTGTAIDLNVIKGSFEKLSKAHELMLVEGAGGLLVPINGKHTVADLIRLLNIPVIIVAASRLGAINHTLLTVEAARARNIQVAGIILNNSFPEDGDLSRRHNLKEIMRLAGAPVLGEVPYGSFKEALEGFERNIDLGVII